MIFAKEKTSHVLLPVKHLRVHCVFLICKCRYEDQSHIVPERIELNNPLIEPTEWHCPLCDRKYVFEVDFQAEQREDSNHYEEKKNTSIKGDINAQNIMA